MLNFPTVRASYLHAAEVEQTLVLHVTVPYDQNVPRMPATMHFGKTKA